MITRIAWRTSASRSTEARATERPRRAAVVGILALALAVAVGGALAPASRPAHAAEAALRGKPICVAPQCPPPEDQRSGGPICAATPCPPPPDGRALRGAAAGKPNCLATPCPPPTNQRSGGPVCAARNPCPPPEDQ
jgi:hypothetical protein